MDHKLMQADHREIVEYKNSLELKIIEIDNLIAAASNSAVSAEQDLKILSKLKNMVNILNLHTSSILQDLDSMKISDSAYRETPQTIEMLAVLEKVVEVLAPQSEVVYAKVISGMNKQYGQIVDAARRAKLDPTVELDQSLEDHTNNPYYTNLNRH